MSFFEDITKNITKQAKKAFDGATSNLFGGDSSGQKYPNKLPTPVENITNKIDTYSNGNWQNSRGYSFQVVRVSKSDGADKVSDATGWSEFQLQINPQELTQDEVFAIEVTPTLRGVLVEHHGTVLKDIQISGTTGVSPKRAAAGADAYTGNPLMTSGHSGYQEFHELRTYFRAYAEAKRTSGRSDAGELRMIFRNKRDLETLYVEPQTFTMKRSAARATLYDYTIKLKGIGVVTGMKPTDTQKPTDLENALKMLKEAENIIDGSIGLILAVESDIENIILNPLRDLTDAMQAIVDGRGQLFGEFGITKRLVRNLVAETERFAGNWNDIIGASNTSYNEITGRTPTNVATAGRIPTYDELKVSNALNKIKTGSRASLSQPSNAFLPNAYQIGAEDAEFYNGNLSFQTPSSTSSKTILGSDDLQSLAARELGNPDKYRELIILNNLKPPYISENGEPNTLKPGDKILLPAFESSGSEGVIRANDDFPVTDGMSESEKNLGVDIRLDENGDLAVGTNGDLDLAAGMENMSQAIGIKMGLTPGSLKRHQAIGVDINIGDKVTTNGLEEARRAISTSFLQDNRVESIPYLALRQEGNTTYIDMLLRLKESNQPIPIPLQVKNN